jgi:hypothetical protein
MSRALAHAPLDLISRSMDPNGRDMVRRNAQRERARSRRLLRTWEAWWGLRRDLSLAPPDAHWVALCCYCRRFRDRAGRWQDLPPHIPDRPHLGVDLTHGICPDCLAQLKAD